MTGRWNLYDTRHDPAGRAMQSLDGRRNHRNAALTSMGLSSAGTLTMWLWKR